MAISGAIVPVAVLGLAAIGVWRNREPATRLAALWAAVFLGVQTFLVPGKEARYFLPLLPALYLLAAAGTASLPRWVALAWWLCLPAGLMEIARFQDPIFRDPRGRRLAQWADQQSRTGRVVWVGPFYPLRPVHHKLHEEDDYFAIFHLWRNSVAFHLQREVPAIAFPERQELNGEIFPKGLGRYLDSGDAILWNREPRSYATRDIPASLSPLVSARVEIHAGDESSPTPGPVEIYERTAEGLRSLGWVAEGPIPEGKWWLQLRGASEQPLNKTEYTPYTL